MPDIKRQTAIKCTIKQILEGAYVQKQGWEPNYIEIQNRKVSRINILATIISKENNTITIDDGTSKMPMRFFSEQEKADSLSIGDIILVIGRPREYNKEKYVVPEIIRKIENRKWVDHRKKELSAQAQNTKKEKPPGKPPKEKQQVTVPEHIDNEPLKILEAIKSLDEGSGAGTEAVVKKSGIKNAEKHIQTLINEGEIYEIRPGKLKIL